MEDDKHICKKIKLTKDEADLELRRIVEQNDWRSWKRLTPSRVYLCPKCSIGSLSVYHLTKNSSITTY